MRPALVRREYELRDVDEQASLMDSLDQRYVQLSRGTYSGGLLEINCDGVDIFRERIGQSVHQQGVGRPDHWTFAAAVTLSAPSYWDGELIQTDAMICFEPEQEFDLRTPQFAECVGFSVSVERLREHLAIAQPEHAEALLRGRRIVTRNSARIDPARKILLDVIDATTNAPRMFENTAAGKIMVDAILNRLTEAMENEIKSASVLPLSRQAQVARAARDFIYANVSETFSITEMCRAVGVSRRTLQYAFESVFGINPLSYIRAVRLNAARRELKRGLSTTTVQDCAARWGFWHLPRFAHAYAEMFGELPSITLKSARKP